MKAWLEMRELLSRSADGLATFDLTDHVRIIAEEYFGIQNRRIFGNAMNAQTKRFWTK